MGQIKNNFSGGLHEAAELKTTYFKGKTKEFIGEWLERNNPSKLKFLFEAEYVSKFQTNVRKVRT